MRPRLLIASLLTFLGTSTSSAQVATCVDPTPEQRDWWHWTASTHPDSVGILHAPEPPRVRLADARAQLAGRYKLTLVQTLGGPDQASGFLVLEAPDKEDQESKRLLRGHLDGLDSVGPFSGAPIPPSSLDPKHPGVEAYYGKDQRLELWVGNPGMEWTDSGVDLAVFELTDDGIRGRWIYGGAVTVVENGNSLGPPQGYFCASRVPM